MTLLRQAVFRYRPFKVSKLFGNIDKYFSEKGFGFIRTLDGNNFFFHKRAFRNCKPELYNSYLFTLKKSEKHPGKSECHEIVSIKNENEYLKDNLCNYSPEERFRIICINRTPLIKIVEPIFEKRKESVIKDATKYVQSFDPIKFSNKMSTFISFGSKSFPFIFNLSFQTK